MRHRSVSLVTITALAICGNTATGLQPAEEETREAEQRVPRVPGEIEAFSPVEDAGANPVRPGLTAGEPWEVLLGDSDSESSAALLPERSFLNRVRGSVIAGPHDTRVIVTDASKTGVPTAMLLLPCGVLERFDEFVFKRNDRVPVIVSGQVFVYDARNYLMPSAILAASGVPDERSGSADPQEVAPGSDGPDTESGTAASDSDPAERAREQANADPVREAEVDALIEELERRPVYSRRRRGRAESPENAPPVVAESTNEGESQIAVNRDLQPDARYISARRGRTVRAPDGSWLFVEDNDDGRGARMTLLPCRVLQAVESVALREGDDAAVLLSGRVYRYHDRDFLLPTLFQRERRAGVDPLQ